MVEDVVPYLYNLINEDKASVRRNFVEIMKHIDWKDSSLSKKALPHILLAFVDDDDNVRRNAAEVLVNVCRGNRDLVMYAIPALIDEIKDDKGWLCEWETIPRERHS